MGPQPSPRSRKAQQLGLPMGLLPEPWGQLAPGLAAQGVFAVALSTVLSRVQPGSHCPTLPNTAKQAGRVMGCPRAPRSTPAPGAGASALPALLPCSLREALVQCGKEHQRDRAVPRFYSSYLLAVLNNNLALR